MNDRTALRRHSSSSHTVALLLSAAFATAFFALPCHSAGYSWQQPHAAFTPEGDLEWQPEPFTFQHGSFIKYIDFENGCDTNMGTKVAPWKHHPWDANATGIAAMWYGINTYVFKRGVVYRGTLVADESGNAGDPIRLTSDPEWGTGEAVIAGSELVTNWHAGADPLMPSSNNVWYADLDFSPRRVWLVESNAITRLALARTPNWNVSNPEDVKSEWWTWTAIDTKTNYLGSSALVCRDTAHLTQPASYYQNAILWTEYSVVMSTPFPTRVLNFDASRRALWFWPPWGDGQTPWQHHRFFLEDKPQYLDAPGEFWFAQSGAGGRLYVRLPGDRAPHGLQIEAARHLGHIESAAMSHVHVSGLTFRFNNNVWDLAARSFSNKDVANASIRLLGPGTGISIRNCRFEHVSKAVRINVSVYNNAVDDVMIADNEILYTDHGALELNGSNSDAAPYGPLRRLSVLRNRMYMIGMRPYTTDCHGHAVISEFPESAEFAGNILDRTYGSGLFIFGGKGSGNIRYVPFSRILIHHNRVTDSLLNCNDWGGIETWQGGPFYLYGNISGNPGGYWHPSHVWAASRPASERTHTTARLGFAYYLDGSFKNYVFNNVAWGNNNNLTSQLCNTSGFETVLGFQNLFFNNTIYKFGCGYMRQADCSGRNAYVGNLWLDLSAWTFYRGGNKMSDSLYDYENLAYGRNIFHGLSRQFGIFEAGDTARNDFNAFKNALASRNVLVGDLGFTTNASPVQNAAAHDFRPGAGSSAIEYGARSFVPWALYQPVGEWQFRRGNKNPALLLDENWYMTHQYTDRTTYYQTPRYHLTGVNINANDYVQGPLENWCCGALRLNGTNQYASVSGTISDRLSLDIGTANFLVEAYIATVPGHTGGVIAAKCDATGYIVDINELGCARLQLRVGGTTAFTRASSTIVNDGQWHHVIAELNRQWPAAVSMYVDGVKGNGEASGAIIQPNVAVTNSAPFVVGKGPEGGWFAGTIEYLRVARGTLADAQTTIDELYEWQFNGPAYKDFRGTHAYGVRDAGAFEHAASSPLPRIVRQPQGFIVDAGGPVKLRVRAEQAAFYQWRKDNAAIPGATNEDFAIASAQPPDEGGYDVIVSNALGGVTSAQASLTVIPEPAVCAAALAAAALVSARRRRT